MRSPTRTIAVSQIRASFNVGERIALPQYEKYRQTKPLKYRLTINLSRLSWQNQQQRNKDLMENKKWDLTG
jgi:hypothetical protein